MRRIIIVGAGIVGISIAHALTRASDVEVTVLERDDREPRGSTTYAPGFVGLYNEVPILTALAQESAAIYDTVAPEFTRTGGLELATSDSGAAKLHHRFEGARAVDINAELLAPSDLPDTVTSFVDESQVVAAARFPSDGSADVVALSNRLREAAIDRGARFLYRQEVTDVDAHGAGVAVHTATGDIFHGEAVVYSVGIWGPSLAHLLHLDLPLFPVAHPYVYSAPATSTRPGPFVRWPEHHVYSRIHGDRLGIGTYEHRPVSVEQRQLQSGARLGWPGSFTPAIESAQRLLQPEVRFIPDRRVNGVFSMTPDNLPLMGRHPEMPNVWIAQALWVTHAAGAADLLANALRTDIELPVELSVDRFHGSQGAELRDRALRLYRDIYSNDVT